MAIKLTLKKLGVVTMALIINISSFATADDIILSENSCLANHISRQAQDNEDQAITSGMIAVAGVMALPVGVLAGAGAIIWGGQEKKLYKVVAQAYAYQSGMDNKFNTKDLETFVIKVNKKADPDMSIETVASKLMEADATGFLCGASHLVCDEVTDECKYLVPGIVSTNTAEKYDVTVEYFQNKLNKNDL